MRVQVVANLDHRRVGIQEKRGEFLDERSCHEGMVLSVAARVASGVGYDGWPTTLRL
jgi:hypothetical protein